MTQKYLIKVQSMSNMQKIASGFLLLILTGTLLLMLPVSSRDGHSASFLTALFTSTSASCVTGLIVADTFTQWSLFGQLVLLVLIQIGGLSFITIGVVISLLFQRRIGLKSRGLIKESVSALNIGGVVHLMKHVITATLLFEGVGAVILSLCFIPDMGLAAGVYYGIFHSVSAFCNAGFDLMGQFGQSSFCNYYDHPIVILTLIALIFTGGIGFIVWEDMFQNKWHVKKYLLHTKMMLSASALLFFGGAFIFFLLEKENILSGMPAGGQLLASLFASATPRTAGFNTISYADLTESGKLLTIILMFIGGGSGSTAGGIKVTTVFVLFLYLRSTLTRTNGCNIFGRRLEDDAITKASAVFCLNLFLAVAASMIICAMQGFPLIDTLFEVISAISTVGMTTGLTPRLNVCSKLIIIFLMYMGRLGGLSFALSFTDRKKPSPVMQPTETINIG